MNLFIFAAITASLAQLVEQLIRNEQVVGSSPIGGSGDFGLRTSDSGLRTSDFRLSHFSISGCKIKDDPSLTWFSF
jgi:hypothetical protein